MTKTIASLKSLCLEKLWQMLVQYEIRREAVLSLSDVRKSKEQPVQTTTTDSDSTLPLSSNLSSFNSSDDQKQTDVLAQYLKALRTKYDSTLNTGLGDRLLSLLVNSSVFGEDILVTLYDENGLLNLQRATLPKGSVSSERLLSALIKTKRLRSLDCSHATVNPNQLSSALCNSFDSLSVLNLSRMKIPDDSDLDNCLFGRLKQLQSLDVSHTRFSDASLQLLCNSGAPLRSLDISNCNVRSLLPLVKLCNSLRHLVMQQSLPSGAAAPYPYEAVDLENLRLLSELQSLDISVLGGDVSEDDPKLFHINALLRVNQVNSEAPCSNIQKSEPDLRIVWPRMKRLNVTGWLGLDFDVLLRFVEAHCLETLVIACPKNPAMLMQMQQSLEMRHGNLLVFTRIDAPLAMQTLEKAANTALVSPNAPVSHHVVELLRVWRDVWKSLKVDVEVGESNIYRLFVALTSLAGINNPEVFKLALHGARNLLRIDNLVNIPVEATVKFLRTCFQQIEKFGIFELLPSQLGSILVDFIETLNYGASTYMSDPSAIAPLQLIRLYVIAIHHSHFTLDRYAGRLLLSEHAINMLDWLLPKLTFEDKTAVIKQPTSFPVVRQLIDTMISLIRRYTDQVESKSSRNVLYILVRATNALWNITDENPTACKYFVHAALGPYIRLLHICEKECDNPAVPSERKGRIRKNYYQYRLLACLNNVAEVPNLRKYFHGDCLEVLCRCLRATDNAKVMFFSCGIVSNVLMSMHGDSTVSAQFHDVCNKLEIAVDFLNSLSWTWRGTFVNYTTFGPFYRLIESGVGPVIYMGCTVAHIMLSIERERYVDLLRSEEADIIFRASVMENESAPAKAKQIALQILRSIEFW